MNKKSISGIYGGVVVIALWQLLHLTLDTQAVPDAFVTLKYFIEHAASEILIHLMYSTLRIIVALFIALIIGIPMGILLGVNQWADRLISPVLYWIYPLPKIAFLPVFMILFGLGDASKVLLIVSIVVFQVTLSVRDGYKEIPAPLHLSLASLKLNPNHQLRHFVFPALLPKVFTALRLCSGIAISALFLGENFATTYGIGYYIMNHWIMVDYVAMFAGILAMGIMGLGLFKIIDFAEEKACPWR